MNKAVAGLLLSIGILLSAACDLRAGSGVLRVGTKAPAVVTKTLGDVGGDFARITTYRYPDARMYRYSVHEAMLQGKPILLEFATPGHCTVCDNQLQMLKGLLSEYESKVVFLHMDQYQNPQAFKTFRVMGDPWTFVIDSQGVVQFTRPGRLLYQEIVPVLQKVLEQDDTRRRLALSQ